MFKNLIKNKLLILSIIALYNLSTSNANASKLKAYFSYYTFNTPDYKSYLETHFSIVAKSLEFKKINKGFQARVGITIVLKNEGKVQHIEKYILNSQTVEDTSNINFVLLDQKRIPLPNGNYVLELSLNDENSKSAPQTLSQEVKVNFDNTKINSSDILLIESFTKSKSEDVFNRNGYKLVPLVNNFIPTTISKLSFYNEIYNTQKISPNENYLLYYYIQNANGFEKLNAYSQYKKVMSRDVIVTLSELDISMLPSGNYNLIIELRNKNNEIIESKSTFFQRSNKSLGSELSDINKINTENSFVSNLSKEEVKDYIQSLNPISADNENNYVKTLISLDDYEQMKQYLIYFWQKKAPGNAEAEWLKYKAQVDYVNKTYSSKFTKGYNSDRGVIYLKYGPPSNIRSSDFDNKSYPYEIWQYYKVKQFTNRRFVFFSPENIKNEMVLLHSNMFGERNDPNWKYKILSRTMKYSEDDDSGDLEYFGQRLEADFND